MDGISSSDPLYCSGEYPSKFPEVREWTRACDIPRPPVAGCVESGVPWANTNSASEHGG